MVECYLFSLVPTRIMGARGIVDPNAVTLFIRSLTWDYGRFFEKYLKCIENKQDTLEAIQALINSGKKFHCYVMNATRNNATVRLWLNR